MIRVSRQKIYDSLVEAEKKYKTLNNIIVFVSYTEVEGLKLNYRKEIFALRGCWIDNAYEVTHCLNKKTRFERAEAIAQEIEIWISNNNL